MTAEVWKQHRGDPAQGQGDVPSAWEASRGQQHHSHVASQPKPPRGSKEGKYFMELEKKKKKKLCQRVLALLAPPPCPASARGPGGGPSPPSLLLAHGGGCGV